MAETSETESEEVGALLPPGHGAGAPQDAAGWPLRRRVAALLRGALGPSIAGSRADLERVTAARIDVGLLVFILCARLIHLLQAGVVVTVGSAAYTHPLAAQLAAMACVVESMVLGMALVRRQRLTMALLVADTAFGVFGLGVVSFATTSTVHRTGTIDWMLPYTVATATAFGLIAAREGADKERDVLYRRCDWRGAGLVVVLAVAYAASVSLPRLDPGERAVDVVGNSGNYVVFYLGAVGVSVALRRQLHRMARANEAATRGASQLADEAQWRVVTVDVFGPVLNLLERAAKIGDEVPEPMRHEADRLIELIEATNPGVGAGEQQ